jgi:hypothetical protein
MEKAKRKRKQLAGQTSLADVLLFTVPNESVAHYSGEECLSRLQSMEGDKPRLSRDPNVVETDYDSDTGIGYFRIRRLGPGFMMAEAVGQIVYRDESVSLLNGKVRLGAFNLAVLALAALISCAILPLGLFASRNQAFSVFCCAPFLVIANLPGWVLAFAARNDLLKLISHSLDADYPTPINTLNHD